MSTFNYKFRGVCASEAQFEVEGNIIKSINVVGGCNGNLKGISSLMTGKSIEEVVSAFEGLTCNARSTSCPDQIACALKAYQAQ